MVEYIIFVRQTDKPSGQKATNLNYKTMEIKNTKYPNTELKGRIIDLMIEANFLELSGGHDWKGIYRNVESMYPNSNPNGRRDNK